MAAVPPPNPSSFQAVRAGGLWAPSPRPGKSRLLVICRPGYKTTFPPMPSPQHPRQNSAIMHMAATQETGVTQGQPQGQPSSSCRGRCPWLNKCLGHICPQTGTVRAESTPPIPVASPLTGEMGLAHLSTPMLTCLHPPEHTQLSIFTCPHTPTHTHLSMLTSPHLPTWFTWDPPSSSPFPGPPGSCQSPLSTGLLPLFPFPDPLSHCPWPCGQQGAPQACWPQPTPAQSAHLVHTPTTQLHLTATPGFLLLLLQPHQVPQHPNSVHTRAQACPIPPLVSAKTASPWGGSSPVTFWHLHVLPPPEHRLHMDRWHTWVPEPDTGYRGLAHRSREVRAACDQRGPPSPRCPGGVPSIHGQCSSPCSSEAPSLVSATEKVTCDTQQLTASTPCLSRHVWGWGGE